MTDRLRANAEGIARHARARQEDLWLVHGPERLSAVLRECEARCGGGPAAASRWLRRRRDELGREFAPWRVEPDECVARYTAMLKDYVDIAGWILSLRAEGAEWVEIPSATRQAAAVDTLFWMHNRDAAGGLDRTLAAVDARLTALVAASGESPVDRPLIASLLAILPEPWLPLESWLGLGIQEWESGVAVDASPDGRALLWAVALDPARLSRPATAGASRREAAVRARDVRAAAEARLAERAGARAGEFRALLDAHDALAWINVFAEPQWGFKGWPGLLVASAQAGA